MLRFIVPIFLSLALHAWSAPIAPSNLTAAVTGVNTISLNWQDNSSDEVRFLIGGKIPPMLNHTVIGIFPAGAVSGIINVDPSSNYQLVVVAVDAANVQSAFSNVVTVTTPDLLPIPANVPPAVTGTPPTAQTGSAGAPSLVIPIASVFSDPGVATAARLVTDLGNIDFVFFSGDAPLTVVNFLKYLNRQDFANSFFHRSITGFVIQGGSFRADAAGSKIPTDPPVVNEPKLTNTRGTVSMAKQGGNPNSATSGFFISLADNSGNLDAQNGGFTVFARVAGAGMAVVDAIAALPIQNYSSINIAFAETPYRTPPATPFNPTNLARVFSTALIAPLSLNASSSNLAVASASVSGENLTLQPISPGVSTITLAATDLDGATATTSFSYTVTPDTFETWVARQSFATPQDGTAQADPDQDGRNNLIEFALASPPLASSGADLLASITNNRLTFEFPLRRHTSGIRVTLESAELLDGPWTARWTPQDGFPHPWISGIVGSGNFQTITAKNPEVVNLPRQFLRLKVTKP